MTYKNALAIIGAFLVLGSGLEAGYKIGQASQKERDWARIHTLQSGLDRFRNPVVFHHAESVSKMTHVPLYQVLTGEKDNQPKGAN